MFTLWPCPSPKMDPLGISISIEFIDISLFDSSFYQLLQGRGASFENRTLVYTPCAFLQLLPLSFFLQICSCALAEARCTFLTRMVLSLQRRAHFCSVLKRASFCQCSRLSAVRIPYRNAHRALVKVQYPPSLFLLSNAKIAYLTALFSGR